MNKPATISRRGFLQSLGLMATTVLLGDAVSVVAACEKRLELVGYGISFVIQKWRLLPCRKDVMVSKEMSEFVKHMTDLVTPAEIELLGQFNPSRVLPLQGFKGILTLKEQTNEEVLSL